MAVPGAKPGQDLAWSRLPQLAFRLLRVVVPTRVSGSVATGFVETVLVRRVRQEFVEGRRLPETTCA